MDSNIPWRPRTHSLFGAEFNRDAGALMLGVRRLEAAGAAPAMDPAVLEETLESVGALEPVHLASGITYNDYAHPVENKIYSSPQEWHKKAVLTNCPIGQMILPSIHKNALRELECYPVVIGFHAAGCDGKHDYRGLNGRGPNGSMQIIVVAQSDRLLTYNAVTGEVLLPPMAERPDYSYSQPPCTKDAHMCVYVHDRAFAHIYLIPM